MLRQNIPGGSPWEDVVGYSRAVRTGNIIEVSGTTAVAEGQIIGKGDVYAQTMCIFGIIQQALVAAGASMEHVVRTRTFITDISQWEAFGRAHAAWFGHIKPCATLVEVSRLIDPAMLVEIEVTAVLP